MNPRVVFVAFVAMVIAIIVMLALTSHTQANLEKLNQYNIELNEENGQLISHATQLEAELAVKRQALVYANDQIMRLKARNDE